MARCPAATLQDLGAAFSGIGDVSYFGPEAEFFLFKLAEDGSSTTTTDDNAGYFSLDPEDTGLNCRREIIETLEKMGYEIEERALTVDEVLDGVESGRLTEAFGAGTAVYLLDYQSFARLGQY